ncbi:hypothetical protein Tco_0576018 [Tanacetum coccineum]
MSSVVLVNPRSSQELKGGYKSEFKLVATFKKLFRIIDLKVRIEWSSNPYLSRESPVLQVIVTETLSHWSWMAVECWKMTWDDVPVVPSDGRENGCQMRLNSASIYRFLVVYGVTDSLVYAVTLLM